MGIEKDLDVSKKWRMLTWTRAIARESMLGEYRSVDVKRMKGIRMTKSTRLRRDWK